MSIEAQLKEIKTLLLEVNRKLDSLIEEREIEALMVYEEDTLNGFYQKSQICSQNSLSKNSLAP